MKRKAWRVVLSLSALGMGLWAIISGWLEIEIWPAGRPPEKTGPQVICSAIDEDARERTNNPDEPHRPVDLVVLGTSKMIEGAKGREAVYELSVDQVLYGAVAAKTIRFTHPWENVTTEPAIFALVSAVYADAYELKYTLGSEELKTQVALSAARLDFHVLSSANIFVGKQTDAGPNYLQTVKVVRGLYGPFPRVGQRVTLHEGGFGIRMNEKPRIRGEEMIYCVESAALGMDVSEMPEGREKEVVYRLTTRLPITLEAAVQAALGRRGSYAVSQELVEGKTVQIQEILFNGTLPEAIDMMGSASDAAVTLAARMLMARKAEALREVVAVIERDLTRQSAGDPQRFRRLNNLIRLLDAMGEGRLDAEVGKLVEKLISHISGSPATPVEAPKREYVNGPEEAQTDVNHALAWLLMTLRPEEVTGDLGMRLIKLRDRCQGGWRREVQLALDAAKIEDTLELSEVEGRSIKTEAQRIRSSLQATGAEVAFSHDGKLVAVGTKIWNAADWSEAGSFENEASVAAVFFSPDDRFLYVLGGAEAPFNFRVNWKSGEREKLLPEHVHGVTSATVSSDGKRLLTISGYDHTIRLWELPACKLLKTYELGPKCFHATISPDGSFLVRQTGAKELTIESANSFWKQRFEIEEGYELSDFRFTPDGKKLVVPTYGGDEVQVHLYLVDEGFRLERTLMLAMSRDNGLVISPNGSRLLISDNKGCVNLVSLPDFAVLKTVMDGDGFSRVATQHMAFAPDGSFFVIGNRRDRPCFFDAKTLDRIKVGAGNGGKVTAIYFSSDGKTLRSIGSDQSICHWDLATGAMKGRSRLPDGHEIIAARKDGRYFICYESKVWKGSEREGSGHGAKIIDAEDGKVVCELALPMSRFSTKIYWKNESQAVATMKGHVYVFDCLMGTIIGDTKLSQSDWTLGGELTEDGRSLFMTEGGGGSRRLAGSKLDIETGSIVKLGTLESTSFGIGSLGLIPGGKYFYIGDPGIRVVDRQTFEVVAQKVFKGVDLLRTTFSSDGSQYATITGGRIYIGEGLRQYDPKTQSMIRIHETLTGKTLWAMATPTRWSEDLKFSPDGKRLGIVTEDGEIVVWKVRE